MPPHPLTNFEIQRYYQNKPSVNGVYSRHNFPNEIKDGAYIINLDQYANISTHWITLYANGNTQTYFDSFGIEHITKILNKFIGNKSVITKIYRIQAYDSVICGYFCIGFIDCMLKGKKILTNFFYLFSPRNFKDNDKIIIKYIKN